MTLRAVVLLSGVALIGVLWPYHIFAAASDIVFSEIMFNPLGVDTAQEYLMIENKGSEDADMTGWDVYPDGIGYYTMPSFVLGAGKSVKIYLRKDGMNDAGNLYHSAATGNMGNTSGSIALFSSTDHSDATLVDFAQYGKAGETWESAADKAKLWTKGEYIAVADLAEGQVLIRKNVEHGVSSWTTGDPAASTPSSQEVLSPISESSSGTSTTKSVSSTGGKVSSAPMFFPKIRAYAGEDMKSIAGAIVQFKGSAIGWQDEPLSGDTIRYLWNFGDGALQDGRNVSHSYKYPGTYIATLSIASGEESASDSLIMKIDHNPVFISELMPGDAGWIEIHNPSGERVDISAWNLRDEKNNRFVFPQGTYIDARAYVVFPRAATSLAFGETNLKVTLAYPNGESADVVSLARSASGKSVARVNNDVVYDADPTPGAPNKDKEATLSLAKTPVIKKEIPIAQAETQNQQIARRDTKSQEIENRTNSDSESATGKSAQANISQIRIQWLMGSIAAGLFVGILAVFFKKKFAQSL